MDNSNDFYRSRQGRKCETVERPDPVVWGEGGSPLAPEQSKHYDKEGFLFLESLLTPAEVDEFLVEARRLAGGEGVEPEDLVREPDSDVVRSVFRIHKTSSIYDRLVRDPRLLGPAQQLLGGQVYIHQSRINLKPGFLGKEFYWHSDFETWHIEDGLPLPRALSISVLLSDNNEFNGPVMVMPGSQKLYVRTVGETPKDHYRASLRKQEVGVPSTDALTDLVHRFGLVAPKGPSGSILLFDCNLIHGSAGNISPYPRHSAFFVFNSMENLPVEPFTGQAPRPSFLAERDPVPLEPVAPIRSSIPAAPHA